MSLHDPETRRPRAWIGKWVAAVGILHFAAGFLIYSKAWRTISERGLVASIKDHDPTATAFWFAAAAPLLILFGGLIDWAERRGDQLPRWLGWGMLTLVALLILPMPLTGAWLLVPPTLALLLRRGRPTSS